MTRIFLGGTCNGSTWRDKLMPMLDRLGIDYFNPVVEDWTPECQERELKEREACDICLYTITPKMMGVYSIAEVVDDSNKRPEKTVLIILAEEGDLSFSDGQFRSLHASGKIVQANGGLIFYTLKSFIEHLCGEKL